MVELAGFHTPLLLSLRDFDPGKAEQTALIGGIKQCIELVWAHEQPVDCKTPAELVVQRDQERRELILRERGRAEDERSQ
jgi:hypothetical protein